MFKIKDSANPVGEARVVDSVEEMILGFKRLWDGQRTTKSFWRPSVDLSKVTNFILFAMDGFVGAVSEAVMTGPDKKATVLAAVDRLYDYVVREALPIWLVPFAGPIKAYIIGVLVSNAIDWVVLKYKSGSWSSPKKAAGARGRTRRPK